MYTSIIVGLIDKQKLPLFATIFSLFNELPVTPFSGLPFSLLYVASTFKSPPSVFLAVYLLSTCVKIPSVFVDNYFLVLISLWFLSSQFKWLVASGKDTLKECRYCDELHLGNLSHFFISFSSSFSLLLFFSQATWTWNTLTLSSLVRRYRTHPLCLRAVAEWALASKTTRLLVFPTYPYKTSSADKIPLAKNWFLLSQRDVCMYVCLSVFVCLCCMYGWSLVSTESWSTLFIFL